VHGKDRGAHEVLRFQVGVRVHLVKCILLQEILVDGSCSFQDESIPRGNRIDPDKTHDLLQLCLFLQYAQSLGLPGNPHSG
jgi:hypothetical protein